jgi:hypothetical protein
MYRTHHRATRTTLTSLATLAAILVTSAACAKRDASPPATTGDSAASSTTSATTPATDSSASAATPSGISPVRGTLVSVSDTALTVSTATGDVSVAVLPPLHVFSRVPANLSQVTAHSFVGVTSVTQPDGKQHATEIHIFPEALRGTGEGSYLMTQQAGGGNGGRSTMTNGTVEASPKAGGPPRMTNGTIASQGAGTLTVQYRDGSQTIVIPSGVEVSAIAPVDAKLSSGAKVVVLAIKQPDGAMKASNVLIAGSKAGSKQH